MNVFQILFVPLCTAIAIIFALRTLRGRIVRRAGVLWTFVWLAGAVLIAAPNTSIMFARWLGIGRGSDLVFYLAILAGLVTFLYFHNRYRTLEIVITELVRRDAVRHPEHGNGSSNEETH